MGDPDRGLIPETGEISTEAVERACEQLLSSMPLQSYSIVVRCGARGCFVEAEFGGCVSEGSMLITIISVPAAGCEAGGVDASEARCLPGGNLSG